MRVYDLSDCRGRYFLSLIILIANVLAPFRTSAGRSLIDFYGPHGVSQSVVQVRAHSISGPTQCFRAVVGVGNGGSGDALPSPLPALACATPSAPAPSLRHGLLPSLDLLQSPPLRC